MSRRLPIIMGILGLIILAVAGVGVGYAITHAGQPSTASVTPTPIPTSGPAKNKNSKITGIVQSLGNSSFVITPGRSKKTVTVVTNDQTKFATLSGSASFSDLQVGQTVEVRGQLNTQDSTFTALQVRILPPMGKISAINGQVITLTTNKAKTVTLNITSSTVIYVGAVPVSTKALVVGEQVGYQGATATNSSSINADKIWLILPHVRGTITAITANTATVQPMNNKQQGAAATINLSSNTIYVQVGKGQKQGTPTPLTLQTVKVGSKVDIAIFTSAGSSTATAVLVEMMQ